MFPILLPQSFITVCLPVPPWSSRSAVYILFMNINIQCYIYSSLYSAFFNNFISTPLSNQAPAHFTTIKLCFCQKSSLTKIPSSSFFTFQSLPTLLTSFSLLKIFSFPVFYIPIFFLVLLFSKFPSETFLCFQICVLLSKVLLFYFFAYYQHLKISYLIDLF